MTISAFDWLILSVYALVLAVMVVHFSRRVHAQDDYYLASREMSRWPIAFSMYVALFSTNTMLGATGWVNRPNGTVWIGLQNVGTILAVPLVIKLYPTIFFHLRITTAYEYLEKRFNYLVRAFGALFFLGSRIMWLATILYAAGLVVSRMLGWAGTDAGQTSAILIIGLAGTVFTMIGGMRGVIWTDVLQFFVLFGGVLAICITATIAAGGPVEVWHAATTAGKFAPPPLFSFSSDLSIVSGLSLGIFAYLSNAGADQVLLQTYLTAKSDTEAKKSLLRSGLCLKPLSLVFPFVGLLLFTYYGHHPEHASLMRVPDDALPVFVMNVLPAGVRGLVIAAMLSAVLTSVCAGLSALSACIQVDLVNRWKMKPLTETQSVLLARSLVFGWGLIVSTGALFVRQLGDKNNIFQILNLLMYPFSGVLLGIFLLGLLTLRANSAGAAIGAIGGFLGTAGVPLLNKFMQTYGVPAVFSQSLVEQIERLASISSFYYAAIGTLLTFGVGYLTSCCFQAPARENLCGLSLLAPARTTREVYSGQ